MSQLGPRGETQEAFNSPGLTLAALLGRWIRVPSVCPSVHARDTQPTGHPFRARGLFRHRKRRRRGRRRGRWESNSAASPRSHEAERNSGMNSSARFSFQTNPDLFGFFSSLTCNELLQNCTQTLMFPSFMLRFSFFLVQFQQGENRFNFNLRSSQSQRAEESETVALFKRTSDNHKDRKSSNEGIRSSFGGSESTVGK